MSEFKKRNKREQHQIVIEERRAHMNKYKKRKEYLKEKKEKKNKKKSIEVDVLNEKEKIKFGEVDERPPVFSILPKKKQFVSRFKFHNSTDI